MTDQDLPKRAVPLWKILLWSALGLVLASILLVLPWRWLPPPTTAFMLIHQWQTEQDPLHGWVYWDDINPYLVIAVVAAEDQKFPTHYGFDFEAIKSALKERRNRTRGASTISQQVAKNLFLWNGRSFVRKGIEAYIALLLELLLSKERILDLYLNLAEWGPNAFGAEAAARLHFNKSAATLTRDEAARLAAILPAPRRWSPKGSIATRRAATILVRMQYAAPKTEAPAPAKKRRRA